MRLARNVGLVAGAVLLVAAGAAIGFIARGALHASAGNAAQYRAAIPSIARSIGTGASTPERQTAPMQTATMKMVNIGLNSDGHEAEVERGDDSEGGR